MSKFYSFNKLKKLMSKIFRIKKKRRFYGIKRFIYEKRVIKYLNQHGQERTKLKWMKN